ncbi:hypothetical protein [Clostridium ganghwense]|uniref:DUF3829 domain-containing protein n=1 Tax=Clostridium ganghwense TaxID=312089 RepID=A0ABT4CR19_9CLOT|nr:hypothetical protein [Clostridium ganghwense]MCY6371507.1 hypothetical protein [Clostridium ganghwense]
MLSSNKKTLTTLLLTLSFILIGIGVFYGTYYFFINKSLSSYEKVVKTEVNNINKVNEKTYLFTKGQTIDTEKIKNELSSYISSLKSSEEKLKKLTVTDKYTDDHKNLLLGLKNNISIFNQIYTICKNPKNVTLEKALTSLQSFRDDCMNNYALVSIKNIKINLPKECLDFINNTAYFTEKQIRSNIDAEIANSQNKDFVNSLSKLIDTFNPINKNLSQQIVEARKDDEGYDKLLNTLASYQDTLNSIKSKISNLTIPESGIPLYKSFVKVLDDYDSYIQDFTFAVKTEKLTSASGSQTEDSINKLYEGPNEKFNTLNTDYDNFMGEYNKFKDETSK